RLGSAEPSVGSGSAEPFSVGPGSSGTDPFGFEQRVDGEGGKRPPPGMRLRADLRLLARIGRLLWPHRWRVVGLAASGSVQAVSAAAAPFLIRAMLDDALPHRDLRLLVVLAATTASAAALGGITGVRATYLAHSTGHRIAHQLRTGMFEHLQR